MPSAAALAPLMVVIMGVPVMTAVVRILISSSRGAAPLGVLITSWISLFFRRSTIFGRPWSTLRVRTTLSPAASNRAAVPSVATSSNPSAR